MASTTGIELGPESCVLTGVRTGSRGSAATVTALHVIDSREWPPLKSLIADMLRAARRKQRFPRRARVVVWELPEGVRTDAAAATALLRPIRAAGFRIEAILSPPQALAALAATRPR